MIKQKAIREIFYFVILIAFKFWYNNPKPFQKKERKWTLRFPRQKGLVIRSILNFEYIRFCYLRFSY